MFELIGLIFGGVSRLAQHWLELQDKQREREHEAVMYDKQIVLADKKYEHDAALRTMDAAAADAAAEWSALQAAIDAQAREAQAAGGWVAKLSASVRPMLAYWFVFIYTVSKVVALYLTMTHGATFVEAIRASYTEFDGTVLASILSFYYADRSLRRGAGR